MYVDDVIMITWIIHKRLSPAYHNLIDGTIFIIFHNHPGISWTKNWLRFDNSYFKRICEYGTGEDDDPNLLWLPTDSALQVSPEFKQFVSRYAADNALFLQEYSAAHKKMSEMGALFDPEGGVALPSYSSDS